MATLAPSKARSDLRCEQCPVRDQAACAALSAAERAELGRIGRHRQLRPGEHLFRAGDQAASCATLISGALKISRIDADGVERILSLVHPSGFIGEMFAPVASYDVVALANSQVCVFPSGLYGEAIERFPALGRALLRRSAEDLFASRALIDLMGRRTAIQRVAGFIKAMADAASHSPCHPSERFDLPLSRADMASMLGLTIETISRQLGRLERDGVIARHGLRGIQLKDTARLEALAS